jgi:predicted transcriptional regulator YheO
MNHIEDESHFLKQVLTMLASQFGERCEVVLHDLTKDYNHTIVDIRNGQITGRKIGGCGSNLGLEVLNGSVEDGDRFNYITTTPDGKILRSSSIYIRNSEGEAIGSICINLDITDSIRFEGFLRRYNNFAATPESAPSEFFAQDVNSLLDYMIQEAAKLVGKNPPDMNKDERLIFLSYLDPKGALQISKSAERICKALGVSKFTLYNDLDSIRGQSKEKEI